MYIESEKIAEICRAYYKRIWEDLNGETPISRCKYKGHVLYNGSTRKVTDDIDIILAEIENKISDHTK